MALSEVAIVSLGEAKRQLRIPNDDRNWIVERIVNAATGYIEKKIDRPVVVRELDPELYDGTGTGELDLRSAPTSSVSLVEYFTGDANDPWDELDDGGFPAVIVEPGRSRLLLRAAIFPCGRQNIRVTREAGYDDVPADLTEIALQAVKALYRQFEKNPDDAATVSFAGNTVAMELDRALPKLTLDMLVNYRRKAA